MHFTIDYILHYISVIHNNYFVKIHNSHLQKHERNISKHHVIILKSNFLIQYNIRACTIYVKDFYRLYIYMQLFDIGTTVPASCIQHCDPLSIK